MPKSVEAGGGALEAFFKGRQRAAVVKKGATKNLEAERNLVAIVGDAQIDSSITIGCEGGIDV